MFFGYSTITLACRSPLPPNIFPGIPSPLSLTISPSLVPSGIVILSNPFSTGTVTVVPIHAPINDTGISVTRLYPSMVKNLCFFTSTSRIKSPVLPPFSPTCPCHANVILEPEVTPDGILAFIIEIVSTAFFPPHFGHTDILTLPNPLHVGQTIFDCENNVVF